MTPDACYIVCSPAGAVLGAHASARLALSDAVRELPAHVFDYLVEAAELRSADAVECEGYTLARFVRAVPVPAPPTRLREYKGVTYTPDTKLWWGPTKQGVASSAAEAVCRFDGLTDADHAALLALRDDPYEPAPDAVVEAICTWGWAAGDESAESLATTVRTLVRAEVEAEQASLGADLLTAYWRVVDATGLSRDLVMRDGAAVVAQYIRNLRDSVNHKAAPLTVAEHVAALERLGAIYVKNCVHVEYRHGGYMYPDKAPARVLILPPEAP